MWRGSIGNAQVTSAKPARVKTSASTSVATDRPSAPCRACSRASSTHLCVLAWGRSRTPSRRARSAIRVTLRSTTSRWSSSAGVSTSVTFIEEGLSSAIRRPRRRRAPSVEATPPHFDLAIPLDAARAAHERRGEPAGEADDDGAEDGGAQPGDVEPREHPCHERERDAVHHEDEEPEREHRERQRENQDDRADHRVHDPEQQRPDDQGAPVVDPHARDRSEEHTSELRHDSISYAVFCLKKKKNTKT